MPVGKTADLRKQIKRPRGIITSLLPADEREEVTGGVVVTVEATKPKAEGNRTITKDVKSQSEAKKGQAKRKEKPVAVMTYLEPGWNEKLEEMLYRGKTVCREEIGLTLQKSELLALALQHFYETVFVDKAEFRAAISSFVRDRRGES